jgi:hypothetical protein
MGSAQPVPCAAGGSDWIFWCNPTGQSDGSQDSYGHRPRRLHLQPRRRCREESVRWQRSREAVRRAHGQSRRQVTGRDSTRRSDCAHVHEALPTTVRRAVESAATNGQTALRLSEIPAQRLQPARLQQRRLSVVRRVSTVATGAEAQLSADHSRQRGERRDPHRTRPTAAIGKRNHQTR